jgi:hypothetical protein
MRFFHASASPFLYRSHLITRPHFCRYKHPFDPRNPTPQREQNTEPKEAQKKGVGVLVLRGQDCGFRPALTALSVLDSGICPSAFQTTRCTTHL